MEFEWLGGARRDSYSDWVVVGRDKIADAAKQYDWRRVGELLAEQPSLVNSWRIGGKAWFTPLHQAAHGNADATFVEHLVSLGAWRTLRTANGECAVDVARRRGNDRIVALLEPQPRRRVSAEELERMQGHFHEVILERSRDLVAEHVLRMPEIAPLTEFEQAKMWFPIPGMYGGFAFWLGGDEARPKLISESWCRVVGGSGQRHRITPEGARLVDEGFV